MHIVVLLSLTVIELSLSSSILILFRAALGNEQMSLVLIVLVLHLPMVVFFWRYLVPRTGLILRNYKSPAIALAFSIPCLGLALAIGPHGGPSLVALGLIIPAVTFTWILLRNEHAHDESPHRDEKTMVNLKPKE